MPENKSWKVFTKSQVEKCSRPRAFPRQFRGRIWRSRGRICQRQGVRALAKPDTRMGNALNINPYAKSLGSRQDGVTTLPFSFQIPTGVTGLPGAPGIPGAPGEVSLQELTSAILGPPVNPASISPLGMSFNDPVSAGDLKTVAGKLDELIGALKRNPRRLANRHCRIS